ncbi:MULTISPECIES: fasciclin domain-containing protein [unclassified Polaribacter]|uniref:fasciclin domain-containing protein n=1 Tax=unclassified Polaribacter TaxID=196858 RepID=UPI0011BE19B6|nr:MULTISPECIES: fasciclin domain-containing protein [unclassified Polaribacter]TXD54339.1 fasciclin domain-containing protein [Polaribacter sp. IC063]TXD62830.1 fasciclin domain-containing protein [Polaribacter sp. IC066]
MKIIKKLLPILILTFFFQSCNNDDDNAVVLQTNTIVDVAINNNLTILATAVTRAGLATTLSEEGNYTVFAPTNAAFNKFLESDTRWTTINDVPVETLKSVLLFHTLNAKVMSGSLTNTYVNTLSTGPNAEPLSLKVQVTGGVQFNGDAEATPVTVDVEASNGIVHVINKVMMPPSVVTLALSNNNFTSLVAALTRADLTTDFLNVLSQPGPYTIFAPTNDAFNKLLASNTAWTTLADIPAETLEAVLLYHVISGGNVQADQLFNGPVATLGGKITIDITNGAQIVTSSDQTVTIALTDVQGTNGVIHVINTVLLP